MQSRERLQSVDPYEPVSNVTTAEVARHINFDGRQAPVLFLAVAPCRSGTTAQLRPFAQRGIEAHYQPLKALLRRQMHGEQNPQFSIPPATEKPAMYIKETIGPYTDTESQFDPLQALLLTGYPPEKIRLIVEMREPLSTLTSWMENFSHNRSSDILTANFVTAVGTVQGIYGRAKEQGIHTVPFVYEALRDNNPDFATAMLLEKLGIESRSNSEVDQAARVRGDDLIFFAQEPDIYDPPKLHEHFRHESTLKYFPKSQAAARREVSSKQKKALEEAQVAEFYDLLREDTVASLDGIRVWNEHELASFRPKPSVLFTASKLLKRTFDKN